jgi:multimeric flavodoxin WrbA
LRKIVGVSASSRPWGNCETAVKRILVSAQEAGADADFIRLTDLAIGPCRGCFTCLGETGACPVEDDLCEFLKRLRSSDGLVLAAPVYFMAPSAALIALTDRLLTMAADWVPEAPERPAVTLTLMGNSEWRGVARPLVNLTASLLGFRLLESLSLVAEGPGDIIRDAGAVERLDMTGKALASGVALARGTESGACPVCRGDSFRIEPPFIVCPICGAAAHLGDYLDQGKFVSSGQEPRWGLAWLNSHVESWIKPSVRDYKKRRKRIIEALRSLKKHYALNSERGKSDVR